MPQRANLIIVVHCNVYAFQAHISFHNCGKREEKRIKCKFRLLKQFTYI